MKLFRRSLRALVLALLAGSSISACIAQSPPVRIMPLGDSLTSGLDITQGAYRDQLYSNLAAAGYNVDFIGTQTDADNPALPDRDHQGMGGYRIVQLESGLPSWLGAIEDPDVVLLMTGTNDFSANDHVSTAPDRLDILITKIATECPFAEIIVASLPLRTDSTALEAKQVTFNAAIPGIVGNQVAQGRHVSFVDLHPVLSPEDLIEGVHPNALGNQMIANTWLPAITSVISPLGTTSPPAIVSTSSAADLQHLTIKFSKPISNNSTLLSNFNLDGGLTISQVTLDPETKRFVTLTTSAQVPGSLYTITVNDVTDRTHAAKPIAAETTATCSSYSLVNGSFEDGQTGWTMTGNFLVYDSTSPYIASNGTKLVIMNGGQTTPNTVISQIFPTVPGQSYALDFDMGVLALNTSAQTLGVSVIGSTTILSLTDSMNGNGLGNSVFTAKSHTFTADSALTTLTFSDLSTTTNSIDLLLDNVRITAVPSPVASAPIAVGDSYSTPQDYALVVPAPGVLVNDTDADGNSLIAIINSLPTHGTLSFNANGGFIYQPSLGYTGPDSFTYHASDGSLDSNVITVDLAVNPVPPTILTNGSFEIGETGWSFSGNYLIYPTTPPYAASDGNVMVVMNGSQMAPNAVVSQTFTTVPGHRYTLDFDVGTLATNTLTQRLGVTVTGLATLLSESETLAGNGLSNSVWCAKSYSFTADNTTTVLTFRDLSTTTNGIDLLLDHVNVTDTDSSTITPPLAVADSYNVTQDTPLTVNLPGVLANDSDAESVPLTAVLVTPPNHGDLTLNTDGSFNYIPNTAYFGTDTFTYFANNGILSSETATVTIEVQPIANVIANGSFESDYTGWTQTGNQSIGYFSPTDGMKIVDFNGGNDPPNAVLSQSFATVAGQSYTLEFDAGILDYVRKHQILEIEVKGFSTLLSKTVSLTGQGDGGIDWLAQKASFTADGNSATLIFRDQSASTVGVDLLLDHVRVAGPSSLVTSGPIAASDAYAVAVNTTLVIAAPIGLLANDSDPLSSPLIALLDEQPAHGNITLNSDGGFTYLPVTDFNGVDSFRYRVNNGSLDSNTAQVFITVGNPSTQILTNPSFESGFAAWTATGNLGTEFYPATDGILMVAFNGQNSEPNGSLSQTFTTVPGQTYTLKFDIGLLSYTTDSQTLGISLTGSSNLLTESVTLLATDSGDIRWTAETFNFKADSPSTTLTFHDQSTATIGIDLFLDNVRVSPKPNESGGGTGTTPTPIQTPTLARRQGINQLDSSASASGTYGFERSEDLITWETIDAVYLKSGDPIQFYDTDLPPNATRMFYRIKLP